MPGVALLRVVQCFMVTSMRMALRLNRIAQQTVMGKNPSRPPGFDPTKAHAFVVQAMALTAALRKRLRALVGQPEAPMVADVPKAARRRRQRGTAGAMVTVTYEVPPGDYHDWAALVQPIRVGVAGVAATMEKIAGKSDRAVVDDICAYLRNAVGQLGAEADLPRIKALEAAALALCPEAEEDAAGAEADAAGAGPSGEAKGASGARASGPFAQGPFAEAPACAGAACGDPPGPGPKPPDG